MQQHAALLPFFRQDYRVFGVMGMSLETGAVWYPSFPVAVHPRELIFKDNLADEPPPLDALSSDLFVGSFYHDPWDALGAMLTARPGSPTLAGAANLAGRRLGNRTVLDVIYEPTLHRVRGFLVRGRWLGTDQVSVLRVPALREALGMGSYQREAEETTFGRELPSTEREAPPAREGTVNRLLRRWVEEQLADEARRNSPGGDVRP